MWGRSREGLLVEAGEQFSNAGHAGEQAARTAIPATPLAGGIGVQLGEGGGRGALLGIE